MSHLPPGFGVPDGPLSFDHLLSVWALIQVAIVILLGIGLWLAPLRLCPLRRRDLPVTAGNARRRPHPRPPRPRAARDRPKRTLPA